MFLQKTHAETSNKNLLDFFYFDKLLKYGKQHGECLHVSLNSTANQM